MKSRDFSIVIPSARPWSIVSRTLDSLTRQNYPLDHVEVLVVRNNTGRLKDLDILKKTLQTPLSLRIFSSQVSGPAAARNFGISKAKFNTIIFLDDDCLVAPDFLVNYALSWRQFSNASLIGGPVEATFPHISQSQKKYITEHPWCFGQINYGQSSKWLKFDESLVTANLSLDRRRVPFSTAGEYFYTQLGRKIGLTSLLLAEDWELCLRVHRGGGRIAYCAKNRVENRVNKERFTFGYLWQRYYLAGKERFLAEQHLGRLFPQTPLPSLWQETWWKVRRSLKEIGQKKVFEWPFWQNLSLELAQLISYTFCLLKPVSR